MNNLKVKYLYELFEKHLGFVSEELNQVCGVVVTDNRQHGQHVINTLRARTGEDLNMLCVPLTEEGCKILRGRSLLFVIVDYEEFNLKLSPELAKGFEDHFRRGLSTTNEVVARHGGLYGPFHQCFNIKASNIVDQETLDTPINPTGVCGDLCCDLITLQMAQAHDESVAYKQAEPTTHRKT